MEIIANKIYFFSMHVKFDAYYSYTTYGLPNWDDSYTMPHRATRALEAPFREHTSSFLFFKNTCIAHIISVS
jgi:hypothetical protein